MPDSEDLLAPEFVSRLEKLDLVARKILSGEFRGDVRTKRRGAGSLFREHKDYTQGDDLRFLDWNVYSRLGELLVKQFDSEENLDLLLLLDASASMDFGRSNKLLFAKRVAAALGFIALNRFAKVELVVLPRASANGVRSFLGRAQVMKLLSAIQETVRGPEGDFFSDIQSTVKRKKSRGIALLISDFFSETGYDRSLDFLRHAGFRPAVVHILDRLDLHPELDGRYRLVDIEDGRALKGTISKKLRRAYEDEVRRWCEGVERFCRGREVAYARVDSSWSFERVVTSLLMDGGVLR